MPSKLRIARIADRIRNELSEMLIKNYKTPALRVSWLPMSP
jgi:hypothetical protein